MQRRRPYDHHHLAKSSSILSDMGLHDGADLVTPLGSALGAAGGYGLYHLLRSGKKPIIKERDLFWATFMPLKGALLGGFLGHDAENNIRSLVRDAVQRNAERRNAPQSTTTQ